jgi:uncharacterized protein (UPF0276 family)
MNKTMKTILPNDIGFGLRSCHYAHIEGEKPAVSWFEILTDNYLALNGPSKFHLEKICERYPVTLHGVGMSLGSTDPLNFVYLKKLKSLIEFTQPLMVSDHLCWTSFDGHYFHELLPLPYTDEAVKHTAQRIQQVQEFLGRPIMIENVSNYLRYTHSVLKEWEFLQAVADTADCLILLDVNNIYVSAHNNQFRAEDYIENLAPERVTQFHLAGYTTHENYLLDSHGAAIHAPVWELYKKALKKFGAIATSIEWDNNIPDFSQLQQEADIAKKLMESYDNPA